MSHGELPSTKVAMQVSTILGNALDQRVHEVNLNHIESNCTFEVLYDGRTQKHLHIVMWPDIYHFLKSLEILMRRQSDLDQRKTTTFYFDVTHCSIIFPDEPFSFDELLEPLFQRLLKSLHEWSHFQPLIEITDLQSSA